MRGRQVSGRLGAPVWRLAFPLGLNHGGSGGGEMDN